MRHGKKFLEASKKVDKNKNYTVEEAVALVKDVAYAKFDEALELHVVCDLKKSQSVRDTLIFPNQFGSEKKILVFATDDKAQEARDAGATYVGDMDLIDKIKGGWEDFDICVSTPEMMKHVGKLGPILGRRGLMPNPKTQTVTTDIKGALAQLKLGRQEFRSDKSGVVHLKVGKLSMDASKLAANTQTAIEEISKKRPVDAKGQFIKGISISSTMGPGLKIQYSVEQ